MSSNVRRTRFHLTDTRPHGYLVTISYCGLNLGMPGEVIEQDPALPICSRCERSADQLLELLVQDG